VGGLVGDGDGKPSKVNGAGLPTLATGGLENIPRLSEGERPRKHPKLCGGEKKPKSITQTRTHQEIQRPSG